jgi:hypothetical protein
MLSAMCTLLNQYGKDNFKPIMKESFNNITHTNNSVTEKLFGVLPSCVWIVFLPLLLMGGQLCPKKYSFLLRRNCCPHNKTVFQFRISEKPPLKPLNPPLTLCECCRQCAPSLINTVKIISNQSWRKVSITLHIQTIVLLRNCSVMTFKRRSKTFLCPHYFVYCRNQ